jgi:hypothetical protein
MSMPEKITLSGLPRGELEALAERLLAENAALKQAIAELRAEVATLKGLQGRPRMKPSGMDQGTEPALDDKSQWRGAKGRKSERLSIDEERVIKAEAPADSRFKGYQDFIVQDLVLRPHVVRLRRERWLTPDGLTARNGSLAIAPACCCRVSARASSLWPHASIRRRCLAVAARDHRRSGSRPEGLTGRVAG